MPNGLFTTTASSPSIGHKVNSSNGNDNNDDDDDDDDPLGLDQVNFSK
mgnify:CR=1 FL=1